MASERARFADTHARLDVVAAWGLTALLPGRWACARRPSCRSPATSSTPARRCGLGLVNHVVPHDELLPFTRALVDDIAPTAAVGHVLGLYRRGEGLPLGRRARARGRARRHAAGRPGGVRRGGRRRGCAAVAMNDESTRGRVVDAAIECILDEGFYRASSNKIAKRAGVTWGVIQYHFGTREALMLAVHERGAPRARRARSPTR